MLYLIKDYPDKLELINEIFQKDDSYNLEDFLNSKTNITYPVYILRNNKWYILNSSSDIAIYINDKFPVSHILNIFEPRSVLLTLHKIFPEDLIKILCVKFAIYCAEYVLPIFEQEFPNDNRARLAITAAKNWLSNPCEETRQLAAHAAYPIPRNPANAAATYAAYAADAGHATYPTYDTYAAHAAYKATNSINTIENKKIFIKNQKNYLINLLENLP